MIVLSGALVLVALVLLVFGAVDRNLPFVYASIGVSLLSLLLLLVSILQRRGELPGEDDDVAATPVTDTTGDREPALVGAGQEQAGARQADVTAELPAPVHVAVDEPARPASRRVVADVPAEDRSDEEPDGVEDWDVEDELDGDHQDAVPEDDELEDDELADDELADDELADDELEDGEPEDLGAGVTVLVVSGRPRYHLEGCRVLRGKEPQPLDRDDARTHGFSPCGVCKPDADETADQRQAGAESGEEHGSVTEALFGEPIFADQPVHPDQEPTSPEPAASADVPADGPEPLRGDDPADDATPEDEIPDPVTDGSADPDEPADVQVSDAPQAAEREAGVREPAVQPVSGDDVPVAEVLPTDRVAGVGEPVAADDVPVADVAGAEPEPAPEPLAVIEADGAAQAAQTSGPDQDEAAPGQAPELSVADAPEAVVSEADVPEADVPEAVVRTAADEAPRKRTAARRSGAAGRPAEGAAAPTATSRKAGAAKAPSTQSAPGSVPAAPAKRAAAKKAPAKKALAKKAPAKKAPAKKAPATAAAEPAAAAPVKRPLVRTVRADALRLGGPSTGVTTTRVAARAAAPATGASVVVVPDRDRFHRPDCRFVRGVDGATTLPKASATRQGYAACGVCKP